MFSVITTCFVIWFNRNEEKPNQTRSFYSKKRPMFFLTYKIVILARYSRLGFADFFYYLYFYVWDRYSQKLFRARINETVRNSLTLSKEKYQVVGIGCNRYIHNFVIYDPYFYHTKFKFSCISSFTLYSYIIIAFCW